MTPEIQEADWAERLALSRDRNPPAESLLFYVVVNPHGHSYR